MNKEKKEIIVRYPPSPTGLMHIGTLRTILYNYLLAKQNDGKIILRIEDTDQSREVEGSVESLENLITWAGIEYDTGPIFQSDRVKEGIYDKYANELLKSENAYRCFCSSERLNQMREEQQKNKVPTMYDGKCQKLSEEDIDKKLKNKESFVIRMMVPRNKDIEIKDIVRGKITINTNTIDDQVIIKSDGYPTYHLASVVDDHEMNITHVIRGEEWVTSTPKHILLYIAFGWKIPKFAHLPLLLNADGKKKLSKRQGDVAVEDFIAKGYTKDAIINFVALLGWNPGGGSTKEIFSMEELIENFDLKKVHKSGAAVDIKRLDWMNSQYIKKMKIEELLEVVKPFFYKNFPNITNEDFIRKIAIIEQDRLKKFTDIGLENTFLFENSSIKIDKDKLRWKNSSDEETKKQLEKALSTLSKFNNEKDWTREKLNKVLLYKAGDNKGEFLFPLRAALTGEKYSPSPMDCAWTIGKEKTLIRIKEALQIY